MSTYMRGYDDLCDRLVHLEELRRINVARLHELEKLAARKGIDTEVHINIEIDDIRKFLFRNDDEIEHIKIEIAHIRIETERVRSQVEPKKANSIDEEVPIISEIELTIKGEYEKLNQVLIDGTMRALAGLLGVDVSKIRVKGIKSGSTTLEVEIPAEFTGRLLYIYNNETSALWGIGIERVKLIKFGSKPKISKKVKSKDSSVQKNSVDIGLIFADDILDIRKKTGVRKIMEEEGMLSISNLPNGVYGYVDANMIKYMMKPFRHDYIPLMHNNKSDFMLIEVHKSCDGVIYIVGYVISDNVSNVLNMFGSLGRFNVMDIDLYISSEAITGLPDLYTEIYRRFYMKVMAVPANKIIVGHFFPGGRRKVQLRIRSV